MTFPRARLVVSAALFLAWLGYLLLLVLMSRETIVLSHSQFLAADLWAIAELSDNDGKPAVKVRIVEVAFPGGNEVLKGDAEVPNLSDAGPQGYRGPGQYILPLRRLKDERMFVVAQVPPSPGFTPKFVDVRVSEGAAEADRIARIAREELGVDEEVVRKKLQNEHPMLSILIAHNIPWPRFQAFRLRVQQADGGKNRKNAPDVMYNANDVRIYPLTPSTREQLEELVAAP